MFIVIFTALSATNSVALKCDGIEKLAYKSEQNGSSLICADLIRCEEETVVVVVVVVDDINNDKNNSISMI